MLVRFVAAALALLAIAAGASAHEPGADPVHREGTVALSPAGSPNASFEILLASIGLPIEAGDILEVSFTANNRTGPPVEFDIHSHGASGAAAHHFNATSADYRGSWIVVDAPALTAAFRNPSQEAVNVSYRFLLRAPPPSLLPLLVLPVVLGVAAVWVMWLRAGHREDLQETALGTDETDSAGSPRAPP